MNKSKYWHVLLSTDFKCRTSDIRLNIAFDNQLEYLLLYFILFLGYEHNKTVIQHISRRNQTSVGYKINNVKATTTLLDLKAIILHDKILSS